MATSKHPLAHYLAREYPFTVTPDDGSYFIEFPDLPGCMTQVESATEIPEAAEEIRALWIEGEYEDGHDIPEPLTSEYSGKFVTRIPKSLHKELAISARRESISLNAYVCYLLAERNMAAKITSRMDVVTNHVSSMSANITYNVSASSTDDEDNKPTGPKLRTVYKAVAA